ncbi:MAG: type II toxin-antitoxin system TacA family antitoxin [Acidimicrobiales bacterium]
MEMTRCTSIDVPSSMATKTERLNLRLRLAQNAVLRRATGARGESTSDYVLRHAVEAAETDLADG